MVHVPAKFRENTATFLSYSTKTKRDGQTDERTDGQTDGGRCNISRPGPSAPRKIIILWDYVRRESVLSGDPEYWRTLNVICGECVL